MSRTCSESYHHYLFLSFFSFLKKKGIVIHYTWLYALFNQRLFPKASSYAKTVTGASVQASDYPRHAVPIVWEHRWFRYFVLSQEGTRWPEPCPVSWVTRERGNTGAHPPPFRSQTAWMSCESQEQLRRLCSTVNSPSREHSTSSQAKAKKLSQAKLCAWKLQISLADHLHWSLSNFQLRQIISTSVSRGFCGRPILQGIKWFLRKEKILHANKCLENAESKSEEFLDCRNHLQRLSKVGFRIKGTPTFNFRTPNPFLDCSWEHLLW
jgi:hypothetical protein